MNHSRFYWAVFVCVCAVASLGAAGTDDALVDAVRAGNRAAVQRLLKQRVDVNAPQADGTTVLHWAVRVDDLEMVRALLNAKANPKAANRYGSTPIELAAVNGNPLMIEVLLKAGADPNTTLRGGETVLMTAARTGRVDALKVLLAHGADANAKELWLGETALMWAAAENHASAVRVLAEVGADLNLHSTALKFPRKVSGQTTLPRGGMTALMFAARQGAIDAARALAEAGVDLNAKDPEGTSALVFAIINGHHDVAALLLEKGADPNVADETGMAALYAAVDLNTLPYMHGRPAPKPSGQLSTVDLVGVLLQHGADPNQALKSPILRRHNNASNQALGAGSTPLMRAAKSGDVVLMKLMLDKGADPKLTQKNGTTLLMLAAGFGRRGDHNADSQEYERGEEPELFQAVKLCVDLGLEVNTSNTAGDTALHVAAGESIIRFLVDQGARLDVKNKQGKTPLAAAQARIDKSGRQLRPSAVTALRELTEGVKKVDAPAQKEPRQTLQ
jgi:ankyrin repeat protein